MWRLSVMLVPPSYFLLLIYNLEYSYNKKQFSQGRARQSFEQLKGLLSLHYLSQNGVESQNAVTSKDRTKKGVLGEFNMMNLTEHWEIDLYCRCLSLNFSQG